MPESSSWIPYAPQGVKGLDDDDDVACQIISRFSPRSLSSVSPTTTCIALNN